MAAVNYKYKVVEVSPDDLAAYLNKLDTLIWDLFAVLPRMSNGSTTTIFCVIRKIL